MAICVLPAFAQTPSVIKAEVDRTHLSTDEILVLTVTINAASGRGETSPNVPPFTGFEVLSRSSGSQISIINGDMSMSETYTYMLHPIVPGELIIDPITITLHGQSYTTQPIIIQVTQGTGQLQPYPGSNLRSPSQSFPSIPGFPSFPNLPGFQIPNLPGMPSMPSRGLDVTGPTFILDPNEAPNDLTGQDFYLEAKVDNPSPYQGEQVVYRVRFFQGVELWDDIQYQGPSFTGMWHEELPDKMVYSLESGGRNYRVIEMQTVLFPTVVGEVVIEPAVLDIPGDIFTRGYALESEPITLAVQPLPPGAPAGYQGAVGDFNIQAAVDTNQTNINEPISLALTINGSGNLHTLSEPEWNEGSNWRAYDSQSSVDATFQSGKMSGVRTYERLLVPTQAGPISIPPIEFHFFDPSQMVYKTVSTEAINIQVSGDSTVKQPLPLSVAAEAGSNNINLMFRPIKAAEEVSGRNNNLVDQPAFWMLWAFPIALLVGQFGWSQMRKRAPNTATRRSLEAVKSARHSLRILSKSQDQAKTNAGHILLQYLSDKFNQQIVGLTLDELSNMLNDRGISQTLIERVQNCLLISESGRYAPAGTGSGDEDILLGVDAVIIALEKEFNTIEKP